MSADPSLVSNEKAPVVTTPDTSRAAVSSDRRTVRIVCCADDAYAAGLAVTLRSAGATLDPRRRLEAVLVDGGISAMNRERIDSTCAAAGIAIEWRPFDADRLGGLPISHHISRTAYFRLMLGELLAERQRVLYLDSDLLIRRDLSRLWDLPLDDAWCAAAVDVGCPAFDARLALPNFRRCGPYLSVFSPIRNYRRLGFTGREPYFNSGLLLIDLDAWRRERIAQRTIECLETHRRFVWCWDQYALNVVLAGHWKRLEPRWNVGSHLYEYPSADAAPIPADEYRRAVTDPAVVHFTTNRKPWHFGVPHPYRDDFYAHLDSTPWANWRPELPPRPLKRWVVDRTAELRRLATVSGRHALLRTLPERREAMVSRRTPR